MWRLRHRAAASAGLGIVILALVAGAGVHATSAPGTHHPSGSVGRAAAVLHVDRGRQMLDKYRNLPLAFVENRGQADPRVRFYAQGSRYAFHFTLDAAMLSFLEAPRQARGVALALRFLNRNAQVVLGGEERIPGAFNYLVGNDPSRWHTGLPRYAQLVYRELWPGIDLVLRGEAGTLKYEFRVRPGARVSDIGLAYSGADRIALDGRGGLLIHTASGELRDSPPVAYQDIAGARVLVDSRYVLTRRSGEQNAFGFAVGPDYSRDHDVIIDPGLDYSTFLGGSSEESPAAIAVDASGNAYLTGFTQSPDFPTTGGAFDRTFNVDTCPRCGIDQYDAFVAKLNATGSGLVYSTFLGGFDLDDALAIAIDGSGNAYIGGETGSSNFPVTAGAFDTTRNGAFDAFVTKLNATGSALVYSTYLGGLEVDFVGGAAVDAAGRAYMAGVTRSADFPVTPGAFDTTHNGLFDIFVTKLNAAGSALVYSTFIGGIDFDSLGGIAIDADGHAYVAGGTISPDYPTTAGAYDRTPAGNDAFVTKLDPAGSALVYSTLVGGTASDGAADLIVDGGGHAWIAGTTQSADFPTTPGTAFDTTINGGSDAFLAQLDGTGSTLLHGTLLGGSSSDSAAGLAFDPGSNVIVTGKTMSADFPTTAGPFDAVFSGDPLVFWGDAFVTKFAVGNPLPPPPPAAPTLLTPANDSNPAQPVTFDWTNVSGAAFYRIQIDDSSTFTAPLVVDQNVTASQYTAGTLAGGTRHYWRVRGVNSAGAAGAWSTVWRFTPGSAPSGATLSAISLNPTSVVGGSTSQGTAILTSAAPSGGAVVALTSSNTSAATVPASVTVAGGATSATFTVATSTVTSSTSVTISGAYGGATRSAVLAVEAAPTQTATLTVTATGRSGERVISSPAGINVTVGSTGSAPFAAGTSITLSVSNSRDAIWSGACSSGGNKTKTCTFTITADASVTANVQ